MTAEAISGSMPAGNIAGDEVAGVLSIVVIASTYGRVRQHGT
jgi:hypothetical protein